MARFRRAAESTFPFHSICLFMDFLGMVGAMELGNGSFDSAPRREFTSRGYVVLRNRISDLAAHFCK